MNELSTVTAEGCDVWAIMPDAGKELARDVQGGLVQATIMLRHTKEWPDAYTVDLQPGSRIFAEDLETRLARLPTTANKIAVIPVRGILTQRSTYGTSTESLGRSLASAVANPEVGVVVLDIDSPGGSVTGTPELGAKIAEANTQKPVVAVVNSMAGSGAYWLASQAGQVAITPGGQAGSIGVFVMHIDASKMLDEIGVRVTFIHAGKHKVEGNFTEPLGDEARGAIQERIDTYYGMFVGAVASGRGVSKSVVEETFGQGRMFTAEAAVERGLADRVATLDGVLGGMVRPKQGRGARTMERQTQVHKHV